MKHSHRSVQVAFTAKLASSGITKPADIKQLGLQITKPSALKQLKLPDGFAFEIPYFDPKGKKTKFKRYRYLEPVEGLDGKEIRYVQAPGSINELYLPPVLEWEEIAANPTIEIIITEGELKAMCAALQGRACIGLGGVWNFKSKANNLDLIPSFKWIVWKDRHVIILFDSDAKTKPNVVAAENELANILVALGAKVAIARLPSVLPDGKTGLDDFIMQEGNDSLEPVLNKAIDFALCAMLHKLNQEVIYVKDPGLIIELKTNQRMAPRAFTDHAYATWVYTEHLNQGASIKQITRSAPKEWLKWEHRNEVASLTYAPGKERVVGGALNVWPGWGARIMPANIKPTLGWLTPQKGNITKWVELLDYLFGEEEAARDWFEKWCAYPIQHPGFKLYSAVVLWSEKMGQGKSLVCETLGKIYGKNFSLIQEKNLLDNHNEWAEYKQLVAVDDVNGRTNRANADLLKSMITRSVIRLNPKYIPSYDVPDCINYMFTSNKPDAFLVEDNDRRFFIHYVAADPKEFAWYKDYEKWMESEEGVRALFYHLSNLSLKGFEPKAAALYTHSKASMIEDTKSDLERWVARLKNEPDSVLIKQKEIVPFELWRSEDLLHIYDPTKISGATINGMALKLSSAGFLRVGKGQCQTYYGQAKLWAVRKTDKWRLGHRYMRDVDIGKYYDKERGLDSTNKKKEKM